MKAISATIFQNHLLCDCQANLTLMQGADLLNGYNQFQSQYSMPGRQKCSQCLNSFTLSALPRKLPNCPHSICEFCLRDAVDGNQEMLICGFCQAFLKKDEITHFPLNTTLLQLIGDVPSATHPVLNEEDNQLLGEPTGEKLCPAHKVVMDIVCLTDKHKICPHCALFGNHKEHIFKRLQDFEREIGEKKKEFMDIQSKKEIMMESQEFRIYEQMRIRVLNRKQQLLTQVESEWKRYLRELQEAKELAKKQIEQTCSYIESYFSEMAAVVQFEKSKAKVVKWEQSCLQALRYLQRTPNVQERLLSYYDGPLEIVTQGLAFMDELASNAHEAIAKLDENLVELQVTDYDAKDLLSKCFVLKKREDMPESSMQKQFDEEMSDVNPFMDCNSEIALSMLSSTFEADFSVINNNMNEKTPRRKVPMRQLTTTHLTATERQWLKNSILESHPKLSKFPLLALKRPTSQIPTLKISPKLLKSSTFNEKSADCEQKTHNAKQPQKLYQQFTKNTLSDFFDISNCFLDSDSVVEYVHRARHIHKIKGLKLCSNHLTTAGFERMIEFLQGVTNINMANNMLSEAIFEVILKNSERLQALRVLNLSHNPITLDNKTAAKMEEVKKLGVMIVI